VTVNGQLVTSSPADELLARLEEPQLVAALNTVLDHADLLALMVSGLDVSLGLGFLIQVARSLGKQLRPPTA
jgi:hypothetical protein